MWNQIKDVITYLHFFGLRIHIQVVYIDVSQLNPLTTMVHVYHGLELRGC